MELNQTISAGFLFVGLGVLFIGLGAFFKGLAYFVEKDNTKNGGFFKKK